MNWGNKLLITFIVFALGMTFLVYKSVTTNFELVEKNYYKQEINYQQVIDGTRQAGQLSNSIQLVQTDKGILLQLPDEMKNKTLSGEIWFYCAYDEKKDKKIMLQTDNNASQIFSLDLVTPGEYTVKVNWNDDSKNYYSEKKLTVL